MTRDELLSLADRYEREEPSFELECATARAIGWYTPGQGLYRAISDTPRYANSLDATVRPEGDDVFWRSGHDGEGPDPSLFKAEVLVVRDNGSRSSFGRARTEPMARRAAELRALAATVPA